MRGALRELYVDVRSKRVLLKVCRDVGIASYYAVLPRASDRPRGAKRQRGTLGSMYENRDVKCEDRGR